MAFHQSQSLPRKPKPVKQTNKLINESCSQTRLWRKFCIIDFLQRKLHFPEVKLQRRFHPAIQIGISVNRNDMYLQCLLTVNHSIRREGRGVYAQGVSTQGCVYCSMQWGSIPCEQNHRQVQKHTLLGCRPRLDADPSPWTQNPLDAETPLDTDPPPCGHVHNGNCLSSLMSFINNVILSSF